MSGRALTKPLSYEAYSQLPNDGRRWEFLDGDVHVTPAPSPAHQFTVLGLARALEDHLAAFGPDHILFVSPIDVILADDEIVQPDIVVATRAQVSARGIEGAPRFIVEVLSPARPALDRDVKARRYAVHGVARYWIADPAARSVECYALERGAYTLEGSFGADGDLRLDRLPGLTIDLTRLWLPA
jgi:Uma2 family endonuclease